MIAIRRSMAGLGITLAVLAPGCATEAYEGRLLWIDGWRKATVVAIGTGDGMARELALDCRATFPAAAPNARYVTVSYRNGGHRIRRTVPWIGNSAIGIGDRVYVNVSDCAKPAERVATRNS
ncbi:MAG: hypothetical protein KIS74_00680 [Burkholderiales bacterium]|nr:hypothetical protein [Burkholderiales bacterium]